MQDYRFVFTEAGPHKLTYIDETWGDLLTGGAAVQDFKRMQESLNRRFISQLVPAKGARTDLYGIQEHGREERTATTFVDADYIVELLNAVNFAQLDITPRTTMRRAWETIAEQFEHIYVDRNIMDGEPCIAGTRIPVSIIVSMVSEGYTLNEIAEDYGNISVEEAREALLFAARLTW